MLVPYRPRYIPSPHNHSNNHSDTVSSPALQITTRPSAVCQAQACNRFGIGPTAGDSPVTLPNQKEETAGITPRPLSVLVTTPGCIPTLNTHNTHVFRLGQYTSHHDKSQETIDNWAFLYECKHLIQSIRALWERKMSENCTRALSSTRHPVLVKSLFSVYFQCPNRC